MRSFFLTIALTVLSITKRKGLILQIFKSKTSSYLYIANAKTALSNNTETLFFNISSLLVLFFSTIKETRSTIEPPLYELIKEQNSDKKIFI